MREGMGILLVVFFLLLVSSAVAVQKSRQKAFDRGQTNERLV